MKGLLYTIEKEKHNEKDLKEILTANPQIKFVSLMGIDLGGNASCTEFTQAIVDRLVVLEK